MAIKQKIFKGAYVSRLRSDLKSGVALKDYFGERFSPPEDAVMETSIKLEHGVPELKILKSGNQADADFENSMKIYEAYRHLTATQASDPRLWVYLTHCTFRKYVIKRWNIGKTYDEAAKDPDSAKNYILSHWFSGGNDRALRRNAIARLWWAARLTVAPWEDDPEYFLGAVKEGEYPYKYTKILFSTQDVFQQVLERGLGREPRILISVLEYIGNKPEITREQIRKIMKELNLISSIQNVAILNRNELYQIIEEIAASPDEQSS